MCLIFGKEWGRLKGAVSPLSQLDEPQFQSVSILLLHLPCICASFSRFERLFLCFTQFGGSFHCLNFDKFREDYLDSFHKLLGNFPYFEQLYAF